MSYWLREYDGGSIAVCAPDGIRPIMFTVRNNLFTFRKKADDGWHEVTLSIDQLMALCSMARYKALTRHKVHGSLISSKSQMAAHAATPEQG